MLTRLAGLLWRQRRTLLASVLVIAVLSLVAWHLVPRDYTATRSLSWQGGSNLSVTADDLTSRGDQMVGYAISDELLTEIAPGLDATRGITDLQRELDVRWEPSTSRVVISASDTDQGVARQLVDAIAALLPTYGPDTSGLTAFTAGRLGVTSSESDAVVLGFVLGILIASIIAFMLTSWRDGRTNTVYAAADLESALSVPVLAHVRMPRDPTILPALTPGAAGADPFRHVRTALGLHGERSFHVLRDPATGFVGASSKLDVPAVARLVVSTSPVTGAAAVWVATNLALALGQDGWNVLLVDGRLGPRFGKALAGEPAGPGLFEVLGGSELSDAVHPGPVSGLSLLASGARSDPSGVLTSQRFAAFVVEAQRVFDLVVVITPSLDVCDDALVMATPGSLLMSVPEGRVSPTALRAQGSLVLSTVPRLLGSVLVGRLSERAST